MAAARTDLQCYRQPLWGTIDRVSRNSLLVAAAFGVVVLIAVFVAPPPPAVNLSIEAMPERFARLILEKPTPKPVVKKPAPVAVAEAPPQVAQVAPRPEAAPPAVKPAPPRPTRRKAPVETAPDKGQQGRAKAQTEVASNLSAVSGSLDKVLGELSQALPAAGTSDQSAKPAKRRQRRGVREGRAATQLEAVDIVTDLSAADVQGSSLQSVGISIAAITDIESGGGGESGSGGGGTSASGSSAGGGGEEIRSNQTLLAVVRKYAPGIQFCYENELKKSPGLRGKMVVSLTVEADGTVSSVLLVEDTLRSDAVSGCVLAQMQGWRFPAVDHGTVTFKTPFVFTPPE